MRKVRILMAAMLMAGVANSLQAASPSTLTWDGGGNDNEIDTKNNWNPNANVSNGDFLIFAGSVRTLPELLANLTVGSITFNNTAAAFTIGGTSTFTVNSGGIVNNDTDNQTINTEIRLGAAQTWTANSGDLTFGGALNKNSNGLIIDGGFNTTISGIVSSGGTLTKNGTGTLVLSGANTFTGATTVNAGALNLRHNTALGTTAGITTINSGGALELQNTITVTGESLTLAGTGVSAGGALRNIANNNTWTGAITLGTGGARINSDSGTLTLSGGISGAALPLTIGGAGNVTISSAIATTSGTLTKDGAGTLTLSGANTYTGASTISAGKVTVGNNAGLGTTGGSTSVASGAALEISGSGLSIAEVVSSLIGSGISNGGALRNLANNNAWSGAINLGSGGARINSDSGILTLSGGIGGSAQPLTVGGVGNVVISGVIGTGTGTLTKDGSGVLYLSGANTFTGSTTISAGTLMLGANERLADTMAVSVSSGATFSLFNFNETIGALSGAGDVSLGSGTLTAGDTASTTFSGILSGTGAFTKAGTGTLSLSGVNTYTGATTLSAGALSVQNNSALGTTAAGTTVASGAALQINGSGLSLAEAVTSLIGSGISSGGALRNLANNNTWSGTIALGSGGARINSDGGLLTLSGNISGAAQPLTIGGAGDVTVSSVIGTTSGPLTKDGSGTLILSGANTYTGATAVSAGTLKLGASGAISDSSAVSVSAGAAFDLNGNNETVGSLDGAGNVNLGAATLTTGGLNSSTAHSGVTSGTGGLTKEGSGVFTLSGANSFTGATTIGAGTLRLGASGAISDSSAVSVAAGAVFDLNGNNEIIGSLAGAGNVTLGSGNLIAGGLDTSTTHSGVISGTGGFTKRGTGTLILSGNNSYNGATSVDAGVLRISGSVGNSAVTVNSGGTLAGTGTIGAMIVKGGGTIAPGVSPGTLNTGAQTWGGGGNYNWEINNAGGAKGSDPGWDFLNIAGTLTINATSGSAFNIKLTSLTLANQSGQASNFDNTQNYAWTIATASSGIVGFDSDKFNFDTSSFQNALGVGSFGISVLGNDLNLTFTAVPEPHEYALVVGLGLIGFAIWRRRRQMAAAK
jgi:fibronectin-binding autotransporter adhesin